VAQILNKPPISYSSPTTTITGNLSVTGSITTGTPISVGFANITSGVNSTAQTLTIGSTSVLTTSGNGIINANQVNGAALPISTNALATNASGQIIAGAAATSIALSAVTAAAAANTIANASYTQTWNWALTGTLNGYVIGETAAGTGTGALLQVNGLSATVRALEVFNTAGASSIHFSDGSISGGYLVGIANGQTGFSSGASYNGSAWVAQATGATILTSNAAGGGGFNFYTNTGLTVGATYAPTQVCIINKPGGYSQLQMSAAGIVSSPNLTQFAGGAHYTASGFMADQTGFSNILTGVSGQIIFYINTGLTVGSIITQTQIAYFDAAGYHAGSDYRYKQDIHPLDAALPMIMKLRPVRFKWKIGLDNDNDHIGLLAHEVHRAIPSAVDIDKDLVREDGGIQPQALNYNEIVAVLCRAMQELTDKVVQLEKTWPTKPMATSNSNQGISTFSAKAGKRSSRSTTR
jgi:hypothetical protein